MQLPRDIGPFHIVGIGGIGMSAIAEIMLARGYQVQGSDLKKNTNTERLQNKGVSIFLGHASANIKGAKYIVISSAVKADNPEYIAAREQGIPIIRRAEMLAELMRNKSTISITGTHGKTTTTSLISTLLDEADLDPTVINGGILNRWDSNAHVGSSDWMVVEADESDGTFVKLPTQIGVVTNIDPEHLDFYGSTENMENAFRQYFENIPFYGAAIAGIDHPVVRKMVTEIRTQEAAKRIVTYGVAADADLRLENLRCDGTACYFDVCFGGRMNGHSGITLKDVKLQSPGHHNALNALAAIAVGFEVGLSEQTIRSALADFAGVKRRFTHTGDWNGIHFYDDYAHHPVEIASTLTAAKSASSGRVIAIMQPHRYTRLQHLFDEFCECFENADVALVTPVYAAGEVPILGFGQKELVAGIKAKGHENVVAVKDYDHLLAVLKDIAQPGDLVIGMGAGTITEWAYALPSQLTALEKRNIHFGVEGAA